MHRILGGFEGCGFVKSDPSKIENEACLFPYLWDDGHWGKPQVWKSVEGGKGKEEGVDQLELFGYLVVDEVHLISGGGVHFIM